MNNQILNKEEWTQQELYKYTKILEEQGIKVVLVDTILKPIENMNTITYNPHEMSTYKKGTVFVFYCYSGRSTKARLNFYKEKLPDYACISLHGGHSCWRPNYQAI